MKLTIVGQYKSTRETCILRLEAGTVSAAVLSVPAVDVIAVFAGHHEDVIPSLVCAACGEADCDHKGDRREITRAEYDTRNVELERMKPSDPRD